MHNDSEYRFARCPQLWDAGRNFRTFRTHQQDQDAQRPINRIRGFLRSLRTV